MHQTGKSLTPEAQLSMKLISMNFDTVINEIDQHECSLVLTANCTSGSFAWEDHCMIIYILQLEDDEVSEEFQ
jgi:hypothetical protein